MYRLLGFICLFIVFLSALGVFELRGNDFEQNIIRMGICLLGLLLFNKADIVNLEKESAKRKNVE